MAKKLRKKWRRKMEKNKGENHRKKGKNWEM